MKPASKVSSPIILCIGSAEEFGSIVYELQYRMQPSAAIRLLRGKNMTSSRALFGEFAAAWQFPYYFGNNWDALEECVSDLRWLPAQRYLSTIVDGRDLLRERLDELVVFFRVMFAVAEEWQRKSGLFFQTVLQYSNEDIQILPTDLRTPHHVVSLVELKSLLNQ